MYKCLDCTSLIGKTIEKAISVRPDVVQLFFTDGTTVKLAVHNDDWTQMGPMIVLIDKE